MESNRTASPARAAVASFPIWLVLLASAVLPAADITVGPGRDHATIQAAIDAAVAGEDRVVVYSGVYDEQVIWNKPVDIVEAPGETAVLTTTESMKNDVIVVAYSGSATWDGIDVVLDHTILGGTIFFILKDENTQVTLQNFTFSDTENAGGNPKTFFCHGGSRITLNRFEYRAENSVAEGVLFVQVGSQLTANDCVFDGTSDKFTWINQAGAVPTKITINRSRFTKPHGGGHLVMSFHGEIEVNESVLELAGGVSRGVITLNSGQPQKITLNRSVLDKRRSAGARLVNIEGHRTDLTLTNCALIMTPNSFAVFGGLGGTVAMRHSTVAATGPHAANVGIVGPESAEATLDVTLENCIFSLDGSDAGVIRDPGAGTLNVTAGINLRHLGAGSGAAVDALTGTIIDADPLLQADLIHVASASPAIDAGEDVGVAVDIDGCPRPAGAAPDLGADEGPGVLAVGEGMPFATINAALAAAGPCDGKVLVYSGVYDEQVIWNKPLDIAEAPGETAVLTTTESMKNDVIVVAYSGSATWDGIDVVLDHTILGGTIFFILKDQNTQVTLQNFTFSDTENAGGNPKTFFCHGGSRITLNRFEYRAQNSVAEGVLFVQVGSQLTANDCVFDGTSDKFTWINQAGAVPTKITINRSRFTKPHGGGHLVMSFHGEIEVNESVLELAGGVARGVITLNSGQPQKITLNRSVLDKRRSAGARLVNIEGHRTDLTLTNCALIMTPNSFAVFGGLGGKLAMRHCTVAATGPHAGNAGIVGPESAEATLDVTLENCIFSLDGSATGVIRDPGVGMLEVTAGVNLRHLGSGGSGGGAPADALTGVIIDADPLLDADFIHLTALSPAIGAAEDSDIDIDIDGDPRPGVTDPPTEGSDLGADEFQGTLPVEPDAPRKLVATAGDGVIELSWSPPEDAEGVTGYNVYRTSPGDLTLLTPEPIAATELTVDGLENGVEVCFVVRSAGELGLESADSNEACATPSAPGGLQRPGDCTQDGRLDISDAICLLGHLFLGHPVDLPCEGGRVGNPGNRTLLNSNGDAAVDLSDAVFLLQFLFTGGPPPVLGTSCVAIEGCPSACVK